MNRNALTTLLTTINTMVLLVFATLYFTRDTGIVYVNSTKLLNNYQGMLDARKIFQEKANTWKANIDTLTTEIQQQLLTYEKERSRFTVKERQLSQELIKAKQDQLMQYQQALNTQAQQEDSKMTGEVVSQVNAYLKKYGEANGYTIIMAATEYGNLAYADDKLDITDEVLEGINKEYLGK